MIGKPAWYCVIQYCPDRGREEAVNVGLVLSSPAHAFVRARVMPLPNRARNYFGLKKEKAAAADAAARAMENTVNGGAAKLDSLELLTAFVESRANDIRLTMPRLAKVMQPAAEFEQLFGELVESSQDTMPAKTETPPLMVPATLHAVFTRLTLTGKVQMPGKVRIPVLDRTLDIPYAYQNGVLNLVKPQVFVVDKRSGNRTLQLASEGKLLEKHPDEGMDRRLIVVAGPGSSPQGEDRAAEVMRDLGVRFISQSQADAFAAEVESQAH